MGVVANLVVKVSASISDFEKQMGGLEKSLAKSGAKLQSIGRDLTAGLTLPLAAVGVGAVKMSMDFDTAMTKVRTLASESEGNVKNLRAAILELAPAVGIGPTKLADALLVIESTGFRGAEAMDILEMSAKASAIGMGDANDVARALTAAVNAYGVENLSASQAADILTATVDAGGAEAAELAGEIGRVVGVAAQLGVSFEQVGAFIATYTKLGLNAAEATTGLSGVLNMILNPSKEARDALAELGLSAEGLRIAVKEKGLDEALIGLMDRAKGNGDAIGALFGNVRALAGVMGTAGSQAQTYRQVLEQISTSTDTLNKRFDIWKTTTAATWKEFTAQVQVAGIQLGDRLAPAFSRVLQASAPILDALSGMVQWFSRLPDPVQTSVIGFAALAAALGPVTYAVGTVMTTGSSLMGLFGQMPGLLTPITVGVGSMAAAFGALAAAVGTFWAAWAAGSAIDNNLSIGGMRPSEWIEFLWNWKLGLNGIAAADQKAAIYARQLSEAQGSAHDMYVKMGGRTDDINLPAEKSGGSVGSRGDVFAGLPAPVQVSAFEQSVRSLTATLNGSNLVDTAQQWIEAISRIGGIGRLTHDELEQFQSDITKAVEKMRLMGEAVPNTWNIIAQSSANALKIAESYAALGSQLAMAHHGSADFVTDASGGLLDSSGKRLQVGPSASMGMEGLGKSLADLTGPIVPTLASQVKLGFSTGMSQVGPVIMSALTGGGNVGKSIGGLFGGEIVGSMAGKLTGQLSGMFGKTIGGALGSVVPGLGTMLGSMIGPMIGKLASKVWGGIQSIFGHDEEARDVNPARDRFFGQFGGYEGLASKLTSAIANNGIAESGNIASGLIRSLNQADTMTAFNAAVNAINDAMKETQTQATAAFSATDAAADGFNLTIQGTDEGLARLGQTQERITATMLVGFDNLIAKLTEFMTLLTGAVAGVGGLQMPALALPGGGSLPMDGAGGGEGFLSGEIVRDSVGGGYGGFAEGEGSLANLTPEQIQRLTDLYNSYDHTPKPGDFDYKGAGATININVAGSVISEDELAGLVNNAYESGGDAYNKFRILANQAVQ